MSKKIGNPPLSPRELEVYEFLVRGMSNAEIALRLDVSPHTVRQHRKAVYLKMGVHSQVGLMCAFASASFADYKAGVVDGSLRERARIMAQTTTALESIDATACSVLKFHDVDLGTKLTLDVDVIRCAIYAAPEPSEKEN